LFGVLLAWWVVAVFPAAVPETTPHALRSLGALFPLVVVIAFGVLHASEWCMVQRRVIPKILLVVWVSWWVLATVGFFLDYALAYPQRSYDAWWGGHDRLALSLTQLRHQHTVGSDELVYVLPIDERYLLWEVVFGEIAPAQFQSWESWDRSPFFQNIRSGTDLPMGGVVMGSAVDLQRLERDGAHLSFYTTISDPTGNARFGIARRVQ
jgi:hypothetical protein